MLGEFDDANPRKGTKNIPEGVSIPSLHIFKNSFMAGRKEKLHHVVTGYEVMSG